MPQRRQPGLLSRLPAAGPFYALGCRAQAFQIAKERETGADRPTSRACGLSSNTESKHLLAGLLTGQVAHAEDRALQLYGGRRTVPAAVVDGLTARGHVVERWAIHATTQLIEQDLDTSELHAVSDRRKGGVPAGYD